MPLRWPRRLAVAGGVWGMAACAHLLATSVDKHVISVLHNASARHGALGYSLLGMAVSAAAVIVAVAVRHWAAGGVLGLLALMVAWFTGSALDASDQPNRLAGLVWLVLPPVALLLAGGLWWCLAGDRRRVAVPGFVTGVGVLGLLLAVTWLEEPIAEARVFAGLQPGWEVEDAVDDVVVDDAGRVWGVRPWKEMAPATLYLRDPSTGRFEVVGERAVGWPPTVLGVDAQDRTWFVSSDADDPFAPLIEAYVDGQVTPAPPSPIPLPPFDAVTLDRGQGTLFALHSDFALPAHAVLEVLQDGRWSTVATPITHAGRLALVDAAVDRAGGLWVWHDGAPRLLHRYDALGWSTRLLPFDAEPTTATAPEETGLDPFRTFLPGPNGELWVVDAAAHRLVLLDPDERVLRDRPLPDGAVPLALDAAGLAWCRGPSGLLVVDEQGAVRYDAASEGLPEMVVETVAIGRTDAWVRTTFGQSSVLLRFDHAEALGSG